MLTRTLPDTKTRLEPRLRTSWKPAHMGFNIERHDCSSVKVGIIDTGTPVHRDLPLTLNMHSANMCTNSSVFDSDGHGTSVAGILCGSQNSGLLGLCNESNFCFCKALESNGSGDIASLSGAMLWCLGNRCDVIICSISSNDSEHLASEVVKKLISKDVLLVCAGSGKDQYEFPADEPNVIKVEIGSIDKPMMSKKNNSIIVPDFTYDTFYLGDRFIDQRGSSFANAFVGGCVVNLIASGFFSNAQGFVEHLVENTY